MGAPSLEPEHNDDQPSLNADQLRVAARVTATALVAFILVAEERHYSRAAERLQLNQSQVTRLIQQLEAQWRVTLFIRSTRVVRLSEEGARRLPAVREAVACLAALNSFEQS